MLSGEIITSILILIYIPTNLILIFLQNMKIKHVEKSIEMQQQTYNNLYLERGTISQVIKELREDFDEMESQVNKLKEENSNLENKIVELKKSKESEPKLPKSLKKK